MSLPQAWPTPTRMARALASYIDCPHRVRRAVLDVFGACPPVCRIRDFRAEALAKPRDRIGPYSLHDGYYPENVRAIAEDRNDAFLAALWRERGML